MEDHSNPGQFDTHSLVSARRFLQIFAGLVVVVGLLVSAVNLTAYRYMLRAENQTIVQLLAGWGRMYKPILYDEIRPQVVVFGASWARDAFDPTETGQLIGKTLFNHAVSGGRPYETRRFADAALDNPDLEVAIVNLDTFYRMSPGARTLYGFDESILDVDSDGRRNRWAGVKRFYSLALAGWAVGANLKLMSTILERDRGVPRQAYLDAYQQADHTGRRGQIKAAKERIFPKTPHPPDPVSQSTVETPQEFEILIDRLCAGGVDIYTYFTPSHLRKADCDAEAREELAVLTLLRHKQASCGARIAYYDFAYPNAMTLEGFFTPVKSSRYYRPDGHPRPTVGLLMAARMFDRELPAPTPEVLAEDFGVDLLTRTDAEEWLRTRAARCRGDWGERGYGDFVARLKALR